MSGFGEWLRDTPLTLTEIATLRDAVAPLDAKWAMSAILQDNYTESTRNSFHDNDQKKNAVIRTIEKLWPLYELVEIADDLAEKADKLAAKENPEQSKLLTIVLSPTTWLIASLGGSLILPIFLPLRGLSLPDLARADVARGLLTYLFGLTTVGIAMIVVLSVFLQDRPPNELNERFQRGKDILTVLIGVFGAILGFYFGSEKNPPANLPTVAAAGVSSLPPVLPLPQEAQPATVAQPPR